ncbi:hypothetical protein LAZ67_7000844 [Cordylochernes scorpioides]|uniref:Reverse transcriptase domain-containing protein n=1 Tax=Cordylochernes scorpioides TaxID=51811 RepID=A0ABY6KPQ0_9ARAC|nr:hypothetical protein LAZ67_7000844 [Cordylochernes scorpioides]
MYPANLAALYMADINPEEDIHTEKLAGIVIRILELPSRATPAPGGVRFLRSAPGFAGLALRCRPPSRGNEVDQCSKGYHLQHTYEKTTYRSLATIRRNPNIIVTRSDKGSQTVVLDTADYASKMTEILSDRNTFVPITQSDASASTKSFRLGLLRLKKSGHITPDQYSTFTSDLNNTPYIYGLPKTHKPGIPLRPIIAYHFSPAYKLSKYLTGFLTPWVKASPQSSAIRDIPSFVQSVNSLCPVPNTVMVSYDVVAMYLSLPHQLIIRHLTNFLQDNQVDHRTAESIVALSSLCLDFTTFRFNNQLFKQIRGSPMGSPLSSPLAEIVMANIDHWVQQQIAPGIHMWRRYIDDIFCICDTGQEINILDSLNSYHPEISFTLELENRPPAITRNSCLLPFSTQSVAISRILRTHGINTHFTNSNSIGAILRHPITRLPRSTVARSSGGSVYSVSCNDCSASYIGETGRSVAIRMTEHVPADEATVESVPTTHHVDTAEIFHVALDRSGQEDT